MSTSSLICVTLKMAGAQTSACLSDLRLVFWTSLTVDTSRRSALISFREWEQISRCVTRSGRNQNELLLSWEIPKQEAQFEILVWTSVSAFAKLRQWWLPAPICHVYMCARVCMVYVYMSQVKPKFRRSETTICLSVAWYTGYSTEFSSAAIKTSSWSQPYLAQFPCGIPKAVAFVLLHTRSVLLRSFRTFESLRSLVAHISRYLLPWFAFPCIVLSVLFQHHVIHNKLLATDCWLGSFLFYGLSGLCQLQLQNSIEDLIGFALWRSSKGQSWNTNNFGQSFFGQTR